MWSCKETDEQQEACFHPKLFRLRLLNLLLKMSVFWICYSIGLNTAAVKVTVMCFQPQPAPSYLWFSWRRQCVHPTLLVRTNLSSSLIDLRNSAFFYFKSFQTSNPEETLLNINRTECDYSLILCDTVQSTTEVVPNQPLIVFCKYMFILNFMQQLVHKSYIRGNKRLRKL